MFVYHPKDYHAALGLFPCFVDFLIHQINENKVEVSGSRWGGHVHAGLDIWLIKPPGAKDTGKEIKISFSYSEMRGWSTVTPIERFRFELSNGLNSVASFISQSPDEYDKMLELFKACLKYLERYDFLHYMQITKTVDLPSLERKNWKKTKETIARELSEDSNIKKAAQDFDAMKERALANLISRYKGQGYDIIE